jgi:hypothetical protein
LQELSLDVDISGTPSEGIPTITLSRRTGKDLPPEGYRLIVGQQCNTVEGNDADGVYWGAQTIRQLFRSCIEGRHMPCLEIDDWPDVRQRGIHYDTKHHQDKPDYVREFIRELARYKINMLVWEWEDKLAYERHPEIGAPGAFTKDEMREFTAFARSHHIQIVPLVQGLGHVGYILKHARYQHLREVADSNYEFCALNDGAYALLFDLWDEAMEATPGSEYLHIGSDETRELGVGVECGCKAKADEIGTDGLMHLFLERSGKHVTSRGRKAMCWYWGYRPEAERQAPKGLLYIDNRDADLCKATQDRSYDVFSYAPNPSLEPLHFCYFPWVQASMWVDGPARVHAGNFQDNADRLRECFDAGITDGTLTTSWDDSGHHNQAWMPRFVCSAEYAWNAQGASDLDAWIDRFFREYFGPRSSNVRELYQILQDGALFNYDTFQRRIWHWGDIGRIHAPDLPRTEMEYNPFFRSRYAQLLHKAADQKQRLARALWIVDDNLADTGLRNLYDFELYRTVLNLMAHNADLILMLGDLEGAITEAHQKNYSNRRESLRHLEDAQKMIRTHLDDRKKGYDALLSKWEETRLPKGLSTPDKLFVFAQDRSRHLANRTADMKYLIMDEELLDLESYLENLTAFIDDYRLNLDR